MFLDIETYNELEAEARGEVGLGQISAFRTKTFEDYGVETKVTEESQLIRYADFIHTDNLLERLEGGKFFRASPVRTDYTIFEVTLLLQIAAEVGEVTKKMCGRSVRPHFNFLAAMGHYRVLDAIARYSGKDQLSIFEVGPGCGYVGVLAGLRGHRYASYDVTQSFYLWQNRILNHFFEDEFTEFAGKLGNDLTSSTRMAHYPWWHFMEMFRDCPIEADVIWSNANLGEMDTLSLRYMLRLSRIMLSKSETALIVYGNIGAPHHNSVTSIEEEFEKAGFRRVLKNNVHGFTLVDHDPPADLISAMEVEIPLIEEKPGIRLLSPTDFIDFRRDSLPADFDFVSFLGDWPKLSLD